MNILFSLNIGVLKSSKYCLKVSSTRLERSLMEFSHYVKFLGANLKKLIRYFHGKINLYGVLSKAKDNIISLIVNDCSIIIPFKLIKSANISLTNEEFKNILNNKSN